MSQPATAAPLPPGPTEAESFNFLTGHWRVQHRRLKQPLSGKSEWYEYESQAKFFTLLNGVVSVEELYGADGKPFGSALRTFDRERRVWRDSWIPARSGVPGTAVEGRFEGDVGSFVSDDEFEGKPMKCRGVWTRLKPGHVTWEQACSLDGGKTWESNWQMRFTRS